MVISCALKVSPILVEDECPRDFGTVPIAESNVLGDTSWPLSSGLISEVQLWFVFLKNKPKPPAEKDENQVMLSWLDTAALLLQRFRTHSL